MTARVEGGDKPLSQSWFGFWPVSEYSMGVNFNAFFSSSRLQVNVRRISHGLEKPRVS